MKYGCLFWSLFKDCFGEERRIAGNDRKPTIFKNKGRVTVNLGAVIVKWRCLVGSIQFMELMDTLWIWVGQMSLNYIIFITPVFRPELILLMYLSL